MFRSELVCVICVALAGDSMSEHAGMHFAIFQRWRRAECISRGVPERLRKGPGTILTVKSEYLSFCWQVASGSACGGRGVLYQIHNERSGTVGSDDKGLLDIGSLRRAGNEPGKVILGTSMIE